MTLLEDITKYVGDFITEHEDSSDIVSKWNSVSNQRKLKKVVKPKKKPADENRPKKPVSGYILYCKDARSQVLEDYPGIKHVDIMRKLAAQWKIIKDENSEVYQKFMSQAESDRVKYASEVAALKSGEAAVAEKTEELPVVEDEEPEGSYDVFRDKKFKKFQESHPDVEEAKLEKKFRKKWDTMSPDKKKKYV